MDTISPAVPKALRPLPLILAACWATFGAMAAREAGLPGAALACVAAVAVCAWRGAAGPAVLALPAALGALAIEPAPADWPAEGPVLVDGAVIGRIARDTNNGTLRFDVVAEDGGPRVRCAAPLRGRVRPDAVLPGDHVQGLGFLRDPARRRDPSWPPLVEVELRALSIAPGGPTPARLATWARLRFEDALRDALPPASATVCAHLVLGTGPRLPDDLVDAHRATGLAHLLAVSGAHASILAWMLAAGFALARGRDPWQARVFRRACTVFLFSYGAITGFEPPVLRALVAWLVLASAAAQGRRAGVAAALGAPALVTALVTPGDLLSVSFCLSYAAVVGLAASGAFRPVEGLFGHVILALRASAWAMLATAPFTLLYFGQLAPWTILGTPLLAPMVAAMLGLGVVTAGLGVLLPELAAIPAAPLALMTDGYVAAVLTIAELPWAPIHAPLSPPTAVLAAWTLLGVTCLVLRPDRRGLAALCVLASLPYFVGPVPRVEPHLQLCAVGHGQSAVARLPSGHAVVVDCGNMNDSLRAARAAEEALGARRSIDLLILSHGDADHTNGALRLARRVPITRALLPADLRGSPVARALAARGTELLFARPGQTLDPLPGIVVHAPAVPATASRNDRSLWVRVEVGDTAVVLPGDAGPDGVRAALRDARIAAPADVLVLPHHGRGPPLTAGRLLDTLAPGVCIASTGSGDVPPLADVARRRGVAVLTTEEHGGLTVFLDGSGRLEAEHPARVDTSLERRARRP